jgi:hypothetical protein
MVEYRPRDVALNERVLEEGHIVNALTAAAYGKRRHTGRKTFEAPLDLKLPKAPAIEVVQPIPAHSWLQRLPAVIRGRAACKGFKAPIVQRCLYSLDVNEPHPTIQEATR